MRPSSASAFSAYGDLVVIEIMRGGRLDGMRLVARFGPPLVLMAVIFAFSAQPGLGSGLGWIDFVGRKLVHMAEYGLLWLLWLRALGTSHRLAALVIAIAY